jgi:hypothetical protein
MDGQLAAVLVILGAAGLYLIRGTWKTWFGSSRGCGSGCGKCPAPTNEEPAGRRIALPRV